jgi:hypothetical protein
MALKLGKNEKARELFKKAYCVAPKGAYYRAAAGKLAAKLGEGGDAQLD